MTAESRPYITPRLVLGLFVLGLGILFLLDNLRILSAVEYYRYWPVFLIAVGLIKLIQRGVNTSRAAGVLWVLAGVILLAINTDLVRFRFRDVFPILLVLGGAYIVFQSLMRRGPAAPVEDSSATVATLALMGGLNRRIVSQSFRGGDATAIMGGCELDLRLASISDGPAVIDLFAFMGGIELKIPEDWMVVSRIIPFMGGYEDKTKAPAGDPKKQLILKGFAIMGGVEVKN